jgi:SNF2-related domain
MSIPEPIVKADISKSGNAIDLDFPYNPDTILKVKEISDWRFVSKKRNGPKTWRVPLDLPTCRRLREKFGDKLELGEKLGNWGYAEVERERSLVDLSMAEDAELLHVPKPLIEGVKRPDGRMWEARPEWRADVAFMAQGRFINANQPGYGKTGEYIGAIMEAQLTWGQNLVFAPVTSLEVVWQFEVEQLYEAAGLEPPTIFTGDTPAARKRAIKEAAEYAEDGLAFWLILNPHMGRMKREIKPEVRERLKQYSEETQKSVLKDMPDEDCYDEFFVHPELAEIDWDSINIDEFHLMGLSNLATQAAIGMNRIANETEPFMRGCMSGTPMGGKPVKLFGALHFIEPGRFAHKWHWVRQWLEIKVSERDDKPTREIEGIQEGREFEFYEYHKQWLLRRLKTGLPPKRRIPVWCKMSPKQAQQYQTFELEAELRIDDMEEEGRLTAPNVLAEYTRLKQFASAFCEVKKSGIERKGKEIIEVIPTAESGKYDQLIEKLKEENVILSGEDDDDPKLAIIASQFNGVVEAGVMAALKRYRIPAAVITGKVTGKNRTAVAKAFQLQEVEFLKEWPKKSKVVEELIANGPPRVLVMNTKAGGTTLTLTSADSVHILDETWDPDDQEQVEDRDHRKDDLTMLKDEVRIYYYRTKNSIEEMIMEVTSDKELNNKTVLDVREKMKAIYAERQAQASGSDQDG